MGTALVLALALGISGCGGDDEGSATAPTQSVTTPTETATVEAPTETEQQPREGQTESAPAESPEDQPGGAGDEEPARTLALLTGNGGHITPRVVRVPAFISIDVQLRTADGQKYAMRFGDVTLTAGEGLSSVSKTIDGLRPGEAIIGKPVGAGNRVRIEATAEPGP